MLVIKKSAVWALAGLVAVGGAAALAEGPKARELREREEKRAREQAERERKSDKKDHPEVWDAIKKLREAREKIERSPNEKERYKTASLASIDRHSRPSFQPGGSPRCCWIPAPRWNVGRSTWCSSR